MKTMPLKTSPERIWYELNKQIIGESPDAHRRKIRAFKSVFPDIEPPIGQKISILEIDYLDLIRAAGLPDPVREFQFHPKRSWRWDFAYLPEKVAIEIHGGTHTYGRHNRPEGFQGDREKMNAGQIDGWLVLEFTASHLSGAKPYAAEMTRRALEAKNA